MAVLLNLSVDHRPAGTVVSLAGELDVTTADLLRGTVRQIIGGGRSDLVLDMSGLSFCDSSGLEILLESHDRVSQAGGHLRLVGVHGILRRVLEVTGTRQIFEAGDVPPRMGVARRSARYTAYTPLVMLGG